MINKVKSFANTMNGFDNQICLHADQFTVILQLTSKLPCVHFKADVAALVPSLCHPGPDLCVHAGCASVLWDYPVLLWWWEAGRGLFREFVFSSLLYGRRRCSSVMAATTNPSLLWITCHSIWHR